MYSEDAIVSMRAADVAEKTAKKYPQLLQPYAIDLTERLPTIQQAEVQWHVARMLSYIEINDEQFVQAVHTLQHWLTTIQNKFMQINCMQALADLEHV